MAVLADYMIKREEGETLPDYLDNRIFAGRTGSVVWPRSEDAAGFDVFMERYRSALPAERAAVHGLNIRFPKE